MTPAESDAANPNGSMTIDRGRRDDRFKVLAMPHPHTR